MTLYDCSGLDNSAFDSLVSSLFSQFKTTALVDPQAYAKVKELVPHLNTADNKAMTVDLFLYYTQ